LRFCTISFAWLLLSKKFKLLSDLILSKNQAGVAIAFFNLQLWMGQVPDKASYYVSGKKYCTGKRK
ncbi:MAG: hypothetical protein ABIG61_06585, partial [Planctomycetota bacterium]